MVNQNFDKFRKIQAEHRPVYLGGEQNQSPEKPKEFSMNKKGEYESVSMVEDDVK